MKRHIPHILHQIWHSIHHVSPPEKYLKGTRTFREKHPGWDYMLWDKKMSRSFIYKYYRWFFPVYSGYDHWIKRVDSLRYFLLHFFGGVYLDLDSECWKNIESLLGNYGFVGCSNYRLPGEIGNGFLAAVPGHPLLCEIIKKLPDTRKKAVFDSTGPSFLGEMIKSFSNSSEDVKIYSPHFVYPRDATGKWRVDRDHPEIYIFNYMDGYWSKPVPGTRIMRLMKRVASWIRYLLFSLIIKSEFKHNIK